MKKIKIPFLSVSINDKCNLNCSSCCTGAPLSIDNGASTVEDVIVPIKKIKQFAQIEKIVVVGGEPLLNDDVFIIMKELSDLFSDTETKIALKTNGLLLLKKIDLSARNILKRKNIQVEYSKYPINFNYEKLVKIIRAMGIKIILENDVSDENAIWGNLVLDKNKAIPPKKCLVVENKCGLILKKGKIFACSFLLSVANLNNYFKENIKIVDSQDVLDVESLTFEKMKKFFDDFYSYQTPICKQCGGLIEENKVQWSISQKNKEEWMKDNEQNT